MEKKLIVIALAVLTFGFGWAVRSNAGTEVIEPYSAPPTYNYAPTPPRPIVYVPPPVIGVVVSHLLIVITDRDSDFMAPADFMHEAPIGVLIITGGKSCNRGRTAASIS